MYHSLRLLISFGTIESLSSGFFIKCDVSPSTPVALWPVFLSASTTSFQEKLLSLIVNDGELVESGEVNFHPAVPSKEPTIPSGEGRVDFHLG